MNYLFEYMYSSKDLLGLDDIIQSNNKGKLKKKNTEIHHFFSIYVKNNSDSTLFFQKKDNYLRMRKFFSTPRIILRSIMTTSILFKHQKKL